MRMERFWIEVLTPLRNHPRVKELRIRGSIAAIEIDVPGGYLAEAGTAMRRDCLERRRVLAAARIGALRHAAVLRVAGIAAANRGRDDSRGGKVCAMSGPIATICILIDYV